jgi:hypothetical protein
VALSAVQLSLNVDRHPGLPEDGLLTGSLKPDGEILCSSRAEVEGVGFKPIKDKGMTIGTERAHKAKLVL